MTGQPDVEVAMARREKLRVVREAIATSLDHARQAYEKVTLAESDAVDEVIAAVKAAHS